LTGSQKAMGVPPGLGILVASPRAIQVFRARKRPTVSFYADWANWIPVMEAYLARKASYFATPAVNLIYALNESLRQVLAEGMESRIARHERLSAAFKAGIQSLGLSQVPLRPEIAATTMTAPYFPSGVDSSLIGRIRERGVAVAGGLHPSIRDKYFRVGHMGVVTYADIFATLSAIERALSVSGYSFEMGVGVGAAEKIVSQ
jgi:alanine-glyoxylate transaminase/serine-glyoxylate transaminase/serine-pyruvate transaminase